MYYLAGGVYAGDLKINVYSPLDSNSDKWVFLDGLMGNVQGQHAFIR